MAKLSVGRTGGCTAGAVSITHTERREAEREMCLSVEVRLSLSICPSLPMTSPFPSLCLSAYYLRTPNLPMFSLLPSPFGSLTFTSQHRRQSEFQYVECCQARETLQLSHWQALNACVMLLSSITHCTISIHALSPSYACPWMLQVGTRAVSWFTQ